MEASPTLVRKFTDEAVKAGTGGFVTGAAAIDGLVTAYARAGNTTNGAALAVVRYF